MMHATPHQITYIQALRAEINLRPLEWSEITTMTKLHANIMIKDCLHIRKILKSEVIKHA